MTAPTVEGPQVPVGLVTYSVKPRGGAVHTVHLAEALHAARYPVRVIALGDPDVGFFRPVRAPVTIIPAPPTLPTLEERVFASVAALAEGLDGDLAAAYPVLHTQDCISARAACQVRDAARQVRDAAGAGAPVVVRTVHHVDDFTSPSLIECQRQAILEPDRILVVSEHWRDLLRREYGTSAEVVHNGVDNARFQVPDPALATALRRRAGAVGRPLILAVGGIEPRKGSDTLMQAIAAMRRSGRSPVLAVVGGHSFQDYNEYRERVLSSLPRLGLRIDHDVVLLGTVPDAELPGREQPGLGVTAGVAQVLAAGRTVPACAAYRDEGTGHVVADLDPGDARAGRLDDARALVPADHRHAHRRVALLHMVIGVAQAGRVKLDQDLVGLRVIELELGDLPRLAGLPTDRGSRCHAHVNPFLGSAGGRRRVWECGNLGPLGTQYFLSEQTVVDAQLASCPLRGPINLARQYRRSSDARRRSWPR